MAGLEILRYSLFVKEGEGKHLILFRYVSVEPLKLTRQEPFQPIKQAILFCWFGLS
jgi:hypothetical protein